MNIEKKIACPECGQELRNDIIRCVCGYELISTREKSTEIFEEKSSSSSVEKIDGQIYAKNIKPDKQIHHSPTFVNGLIYSFGFYIPIYNISMLAEITEGRTWRFFWIALLCGFLFLKLVLISFFSLSFEHLSTIAIWLIADLIFLSIIYGLIYARSNTVYTIGNIVGILFFPLAVVFMVGNILLECLRIFIFSPFRS